ncbi:MAG: single-stranded-DNA-specific exonuclease RecJ [Candidatus Omnitrophica bacterium]|nr:single-stranded-DNA-specific exonuclease RecJ [Candidatus Omnitrophota bacterium]
MKRWVVHPSLHEAGLLASEFGLHPLVASLLLRRGFQDPLKISRFLRPSAEFLKDPLGDPEMVRAAGRIRQAISRHEPILIYGDYDVDGITGSAILYLVLKKMGVEAKVHIPDRFKEGYGLKQETLERIAKGRCSLVITVDNGIRALGEVDFLRGAGIDAIVVDHHEPADKLPEALALVRGKAGEEDACLAACGLAFKLGWALLGNFRDVQEHLDLVVLGTVADVAPVTGENRALLAEGLPALMKTRKAGLRMLMEAASLAHREISYRDVAFYLAPRLNAAGRMGSALDAFKLLVTDNREEARDLARRLEEANRLRQRMEAAAFQEAKERIEKDEAYGKASVLVVESSGWHEGVTGILAARLVERFQKPAVVIALNGAIGKGSGRSTASLSLLKCVLECEDLLESAGGHAKACGLTIREENIPLFRERLDRSVRGTSSDLFLTVEAEGEVSFSDFQGSFLQDLGRLGPFGPGNPRPLFLTRGVRCKSGFTRKGRNAFQCWVTDGARRFTFQAIGWEKRRQGLKRAKLDPDKLLDIVHHPVLGREEGVPFVELHVEDWREV